MCPRWAVFVSAQARWNDFCAVMFVAAKPIHGESSPKSCCFREISFPSARPFLLSSVGMERREAACRFITSRQ